jgi:hypothetical protein
MLLWCICFLIMCAYRQTKYSENEANQDNDNKENEENEENEENDDYKEFDLSPFILCECSKNLMMGHMNRVEHKLQCDEFWKLNPDRTKEELLKTEGFT